MNAIASAALEFVLTVGTICLAIVTAVVGLAVVASVVVAIWCAIREAIASYQKESRK